MFKNIQQPNYGSMGETKPLGVKTGGGDATGPASSVLPSSTRGEFSEQTLENVTPVSSGKSNNPASSSLISTNSYLLLSTRAGLSKGPINK
jgi:hypothetical protein